MRVVEQRILRSSPPGLESGDGLFIESADLRVGAVHGLLTVGQPLPLSAERYPGQGRVHPGGPCPPSRRCSARAGRRECRGCGRRGYRAPRPVGRVRPTAEGQPGRR